MTEDEAKTKWCPHVRYLATFRNDAGKLEAAGCFNRGGADSGLQTSLCIGSGCMMWRVYRGNGWCGLAGHNYNNGRRK